MAAFLDVCRFNPSAGGTGDFTFLSAVPGYLAPASAGAVNGTKYKYRAESADLTQWEIGEGAYNTTTGVLARTTVLFNSAGTTAKIAFAAPPQVAVVALKEDLISVEEANTFSDAQQTQARRNINAAAPNRTRTVLTSGSGTYTTKSGCLSILVRMVGGGAGGGGGGSSGGSSGGAGGATTFGTSLLVASGGNPGGPGSAYSAGSGASGGDINAIGGGGGFGGGAGFGSSSNMPGGAGGASAFGGGGSAGFPGANGQAGQALGSGGGGGGGIVGSGFGGGGGSAGGYCEKLIVAPSASYAYSVGAGGGPGGAAGSGGGNGGAGAAGIIIIDEFY